MARFWVDNGHGGTDPGAVANGLVEKDINLYVGLRIKYHLERHGQACGITRIDDTTVPLDKRPGMINAFKPDYVVSTHQNAGGGDGYDIIYSKNGGASLQLANRIAAEFDKLGQNRHRIFYRLGSDGKDYYAIIRMVKAPSVIAEFAFLDTKDSKQIDERWEQDAVAKAIAKAMLEQAGIAWIEEGKGDMVERLVISYGDGDWAAATLAAYKLKCGVILREIFEARRDENKSRVYYIVGGPETYDVKVTGAIVYHLTGQDRIGTALKALK